MVVVRDAAGIVVCRTDLPPLEPVRLQYLMEQLGIVTPRDDRQISVLNFDTSAVLEVCTIRGAVLSDRISPSDIINVETSLALTMREYIKRTVIYRVLL